MAKKTTRKTKAIMESIVMPAVTPDQAEEAWKKYEDMKTRIATKSDIQEIGDENFLKKSYWRKIATFFNLTTEVVEESREQLGKTFIWHFTIKAVAPNGRSAVGVGSCDMFEKAEFNGTEYRDQWGNVAKPNSLHNIRSTAETRATNRAISNLVGGGEVSAEEVDQTATNQEYSGYQSKRKQTSPQATSQNSGGGYPGEGEYSEDWDIYSKTIFKSGGEEYKYLRGVNKKGNAYEMLIRDPKNPLEDGDYSNHIMALNRDKSPNQEFINIMTNRE